MRVISVKEAALALGVSQQRIQQLISTGRIPSQRLGRAHMLKVRDVEKLAAQERKPGRPHSI